MDENKELSLNEFQEHAKTTAIYDRSLALLYPALGLCGESGEVAEKVKKMLRDDKGILSNDRKNDIIKELGDVLWYISVLASDLDVTLEEVANANISKLKSRKERNVLNGSGDNR